MNTQKKSLKQSGEATYAPPAIVHRGALKQFSGSPLGEGETLNPSGLPTSQ